MPHDDYNAREIVEAESDEYGCETRQENKGHSAQAIRPRTALLTLVMQVILLWWVADSEISRGVYLICYSLMMPTALYLLFVRVLRKWLPFNDRELLLSYIVLTCTIPIVGFGGLRFLIEGLGFIRFFSVPQPHWAQYLPFLSRLPVLNDAEAARVLYQGNASVPWGAWIVPIGFWSFYLLFLSGLWLSLAGIFRKVWITQEKLTFPVATLPLRMMDPQDDIFRRPIFWCGFVIPVVLQSLLVIHQWVPSVPAIQLKAFDVKPLIFTVPPWNAIPMLWVAFLPMAIGLAYFVPSNVSFSCWFLAIAMKAMYVLAAMFGIEAAGGGVSRFPYPEEQAVGAWIMLGALLIWGARHHWKSVWKQVPDVERASVRWMSLLAFGFAALCAVMMAGVGMPVVSSIGVITIYAAYVICGARIRAEAGGSWIFAPGGWVPNRVVDQALGVRGVSTGELVSGGHFQLIHIDIRAQSLPYLMEGLCIAEKTGIRWKTVLMWTAAGTVTALAIGWWSSLSKLYSLGAATAKTDQFALWQANRCFNDVHNLAVTRPGTDWEGLGAVGFGVFFTAVCALSRRVGPFALHPVGYAAANTLTMEGFIVPFFIAWIAKTATLRVAGGRGYRNSVPFFVGMILGDIVTQGGWALFGMVFNVPIYQFLS